MSSKPTRTEVRKLIKLLAGYILTDGSHIKIQSRAYQRWFDFLEALERKYPAVSFRDEATTREMTDRAKALDSQKLFRGPGATF